MFQKDNLAVRGLTGSNIFFAGVGAIAEYACRDSKLKEFANAYETELRRVLDSLLWDDVPIYKKTYSRGMIFAIPTEFDLIYAGCKILSITFDLVSAKFNNQPALDFSEEIDYLEHVVAKERYKTLRNIYNEAKARSLNLYLQDGVVSIGSGSGAFIANIDDIGFDDVPWNNIYEIPSVMVTGTNGKTTTVRLTGFISQFAGKVVGYCSTDGVVINDAVIAKGDLSGPNGNRMVMTNPQVEVAVLEVARGGIVKRGLATSNVSAAVVMNVSEDHLGVNGIDTVHDLARLKFTVHDAVRPEGHNIVNLDDGLSREFIEELPCARAFFSQKMAEKEVLSYITRPEDYVVMVVGDQFVVYRDGVKHLIAKVNDVDLTYKGRAKHNIENVLAAICLSLELGCTYQQIGDGLRAFANTLNNHGRFNMFNVEGSTILVDYGHNLASVDNMLKFAREIAKPNAKITVLLGFSGDRKFMLDSIAKSVVKHKIEEVILKLFTNHLRGAKVGETAAILRERLAKNGYDLENIIATVEHEIEALDLMLPRLNPDDICVLFCQDDAVGIIDKLKNTAKIC